MNENEEFENQTSPENNLSLLRTKNQTGEQILAQYIRSTGYYEVEGLDQARSHITLIWQEDQIFLDELPFITGRLNIYSRASVEAQIVQRIVELNENNALVRDGLVVRGVREIQARVVHYTNFVVLCITLLLLTYLTQEFAFYQPLWRHRVVFDEYLKFTVGRIVSCVLAFLLFLVGLFRCYFWTRWFQITQWIIGALMLFSVILQTYSANPDQYAQSIVFLGISFTIFFICSYYYLSLTYQALKLLVLIKELPIELLKKDSQAIH